MIFIHACPAWVVWQPLLCLTTGVVRGCSCLPKCGSVTAFALLDEGGLEGCSCLPRVGSVAAFALFDEGGREGVSSRTHVRTHARTQARAHARTRAHCFVVSLLFVSLFLCFFFGVSVFVFSVLCLGVLGV